MTALVLTITRAGLERFTAAQLDDDLDLAVATVGLSDSSFVSAPTLTVLPGEFKRLATISGEQVGDNLVHMTIRDDSTDTYTARAFGLFLDDGTLFATYAQAETLFQKSPRASFLAAIDIAFPTGDVSELTFGDTSFLNPPATSVRKGVVRFATPLEVDAGTSTDSAVTPAGVRRTLPIGAITLWYGAAATVPAGWAICDGRTVARSDGAGMIATPDMRGRVAVGFTGGLAIGETFGERTRTVDTTLIGQHDHGVSLNGQADQKPTGVAVTLETNTGTAGGGTGTSIRAVNINDPTHGHGVTVAGRSDAAGAHLHSVTVDVAQPSLVLLYIMRV